MLLDSLETRLRHHIQHLSVNVGERNVFRPSALRAAAGYIRSEWREQGYVVAAQSYQAAGVKSENLEVTWPGTGNPEQIILLGAHYDSVSGSPGANDNASGVAALLEISRFVRASKPENTLRFVAFVNEEPPFFYWSEMGSLVYAKAARKRGDPIRMMLSLEMLGCFRDDPGSQRYPACLKYWYPDRGNFVAFVSNLRSRKELRRTVAVFRAHSDFPAENLAAPYFLRGIGWSDQLSFWRQGYRGIMVTDTAFFRYPYYHSALDTADKLNYVAMTRLVEGLQRMVVELAG